MKDLRTLIESSKEVSSVVNRLTEAVLIENDTVEALARLEKGDPKIDKLVMKLRKSSWSYSDIKKSVKKEQDKIKAGKKDRADKRAADKLAKVNDLAGYYFGKPWNEKLYYKWVKDVSWYEGGSPPSDYGSLMAQVGKDEKGLVEWLKKFIKREGGDETPLERIQWDVEAEAF